MTRLAYPFSLAVVFTAFTSGTLAAPPQKGPAYYTEFHGAGALIQCMAAMGQVDSKYYDVRDKAIRPEHGEHGDRPRRTWWILPVRPNRRHSLIHGTIEA